MVPKSVHVGNDGHLFWQEALPEDDRHELPSEDLLGAFTALAMATPAEMATFMETYGVPELCAAHGQPDQHRPILRPHLRSAPIRAAHKGRYCPIGFDEYVGGPYVTDSAVRTTARAFVAAQRLGTALSARTDGDPDDWRELSLVGEQVGWRSDRGMLADWVTELLASCGVRPVAMWEPNRRLTVVHEADGLLGVLAVILSREIGQGDRYTCDVCGVPVDRVRPPKSSERVYCKKPACRREQQRRNQAKWRANRKTEKG